MVIHMKGNGSVVNLMEKEDLHGMTVEYTRETGITTNSMEKENSRGIMAEFTRVTGLMEVSTE